MSASRFKMCQEFKLAINNHGERDRLQCFICYAGGLNGHEGVVPSTMHLHTIKEMRP